MNPVYQLFNSLRVNGILQGVIQDPRLLPAPMIWADRIPDRPAPEEEILARFYGQTYIADLIADDAKAGVYDMGTFQFESGKIPNIKTGIKTNQSTINILNRLTQYNSLGALDAQLFNDWQTGAVINALYGVELRKEQLRVAMLMGEMNYDRLGIKMTSNPWAFYPDLKVTVSTDWSNTNALGLSDISTLLRLARVKYGKVFDRITIPTPAFQYLTQQTQFINQAKTFGFGMFNGVPAPAIPLQSDGMLRTVLEKLLSGMSPENGAVTVEVDDRRYPVQASDGSVSYASFQPITKVILTSSQDDGNTNVWDFAQGVVTESIVASLLPNSMVGQLKMGTGPMSYVTASDAALNPAGIITWAVDRGFPRRKLVQCSACLTVGSFVDPIPTSIVLPV